MKIKCEVINDLLPLYVDDVLSEASKELVDEHIAECENCRSNLENMKATIKLPVNREVRMDDTKSLMGLKKLVNRKIRIAVAAALAVVAILALALQIVCRMPFVIPYDESNFKFVEQSNGYSLQYLGEGDIMFNASGDQKGEWTIEFSQTLWDRYIHPIYGADTNYWLCGKGEITKLTASDGTVIWEGSEEDKAAYKEWFEKQIWG